MTDTITDRDLGNLSNAIKAPWSRAHQEFTPQNWEHIITKIIGIVSAVNWLMQDMDVDKRIEYYNYLATLTEIAKSHYANCED